jgi:hypothetical protein
MLVHVSREEDVYPCDVYGSGTPGAVVGWTWGAGFDLVTGSGWRHWISASWTIRLSSRRIDSSGGGGC